MTTVKIVEIKGRGRTLGRAHGEALREPIRGFAATAHEIHQVNLGGGVDRAELLEIALKNAWRLKRFSPVLYEELEGIAEGAGVPIGDVLLINSFLELEDLRAPALGRRLSPALGSLPVRPESRDPVGTGRGPVRGSASEPPSGTASAPASDPGRRPLKGCTTFNVKPRAASGGKPLLGQTYDMERYYASFNAVLKIADPDGRSRLIYTLAGVLGLNGLNSEGVGLVINKLVADDAREGVIYPFLVRQALDQARIGDALSVLAFSPRASSMCFQLSSPEGVAFCLETTATRHAFIDFRDSLAHANHYLDPSLKALESPGWLTQGGTFVRLQVAQELLDDFRGRLEVDHLVDLCRNHVNHPRSVCAHAYEGESDHLAYATIAAVILEPSNGVMRVSGVHPCRNVFQIISL